MVKFPLEVESVAVRHIKTSGANAAFLAAANNVALTVAAEVEAVWRMTCLSLKTAEDEEEHDDGDVAAAGAAEA